MSETWSSTPRGGLLGLEPQAAGFPVSTLSTFTGQLVRFTANSEAGIAEGVLTLLPQGLRSTQKGQGPWGSRTPRCGVKMGRRQRRTVIADRRRARSRRAPPWDRARHKASGVLPALPSLGLTQRGFRKALPRAAPRFPGGPPECSGSWEGRRGGLTIASVRRHRACRVTTVSPAFWTQLIPQVPAEAFSCVTQSRSGKGNAFLTYQAQAGHLIFNIIEVDVFKHTFPLPLGF